MVCIPNRGNAKRAFKTQHALQWYLKGGGGGGVTCPEGQAQHRLVHGILQAEVRNDLEVVGGMKRIGCNPSTKQEGRRYNSESCKKGMYTVYFFKKR